MEYVLEGLTLLFDYRLYLIVLIGTLIIMPYTIISGGLLIGSLYEDNFIIRFFSYHFVGIGLETFVHLFIYLNLIWIVFYGVDYFEPALVLQTMIDSPHTTLRLMFITLILCFMFSGNDFEFLIGIVLVGLFVDGGSYIPPIPNFMTIFWIILSAILLIYLGYLLVLLITSIFGKGLLKALDAAKYLNHETGAMIYASQMNIVEILLIYYFRKVLSVIPMAIYTSWLLKENIGA
jgi:hypothetical protein